MRTSLHRVKSGQAAWAFQASQASQVVQRGKEIHDDLVPRLMNGGEKGHYGA